MLLTIFAETAIFFSELCYMKIQKSFQTVFTVTFIVHKSLNGRVCIHYQSKVFELYDFFYVLFLLLSSVHQACIYLIQSITKLKCLLSQRKKKNVIYIYIYIYTHPHTHTHWLQASEWYRVYIFISDKCWSLDLSIHENTGEKKYSTVKYW